METLEQFKPNEAVEVFDANAEFNGVVARFHHFIAGCGKPLVIINGQLIIVDGVSKVNK